MQGMDGRISNVKYFRSVITGSIGGSTFNIRIVADCEHHSCQVTRKLKRATIPDFTEISAIIFIDPKFTIYKFRATNQKEQKRGLRLFYTLSIKFVNIDNPFSFLP
jgi:hypothetical protein